MRRINLLLASAERRTGSALEAAVLDVCFEQAVVQSRRTVRIDELVYFGSRDDFQLIIIVADSLLAEPSRGGGAVPVAEAVRAIRLIREHQSTPIVAAAVSPQDEPALLEAGANFVNVGLVLNRREVQAAVRDLLHIPEPVAAAAAERWSFGEWLRGAQRLKST